MFHLDFNGQDFTKPDTLEKTILRFVTDYAAEYASDKRKLYKIGVNFSSATGTISDWKVA